MSSSAVFQEVIDVGFGTQEFSESLDKLITIYKEKMSEMESQGFSADSLGIAGLGSSVSSELEEVKASFATLSETVRNSFAEVAEGLIESNERISTSTNSATTKVDNAWKKTCRNQLNELAELATEGEAVSDRLSAGIANALHSRMSMSSGVTDRAQFAVYEQLQAGGEEAYSKLDAMQKQWYRNYSNTQAQAADVTKVTVAEIEAAWDDAFVEDEARARKRIGLIEQAYRMDAKIARESGILTQEEVNTLHTEGLIADEVWTRRRIALIEQAYAIDARLSRAAGKITVEELTTAHAEAIVADEAWVRKRIALIEQAYAMDAKIARAAGKVTQEEVNTAHERGLVEDEAWVRKRIALINSAYAEDAKRSKGAEPAGDKTPGTFMQGLGAGARGNPSGKGMGFDMGEMLGQVARFQLLWGAVGVAMNAVGAIGRSITESIKEGVTYLNELQQKSDELKGVLLDNVKFSDNLAENYQKASENATKVTAALQDISVKDNLDATQLQSAFKALTEGGGASVSKDLQDMVNLTELFGLAMKASGKETQVTRSLIGDIPKLLDNSIDKHSKLLEVLHMTKDQWSEVRAKALETGNLYAELEPKMAPYLDAMAKAELHQAALNRNLDLMKERMEASIVKPLWEWWTTVLQSASEYFTKHREQIIAIGSVFSGFIASLFNALVTLGNITGAWAVILDVVKLIAVVLINIAGTLSIVLDSFKLVGQEIYRLMQVVADPTKWLKKEEWKKALDDIAELHAKAVAKMEDTAQNVNIAVNGPTPTAPTDGGLHDKITSIHPPPDNSKKKAVSNKELIELETQYAAELKKILEEEEGHRKAIEYQVKSGAITQRTASNEIIASHGAELSAVSALAKKYEDLARIKKGTPEAKANFTTKANKNTETQAIATITAASTEPSKTTEVETAAKVKAAKDEETLAAQHYKRMSDLNKQATKEGTQSKLEEFDKQRAIDAEAYNSKQASLAKQFVAESGNAAKESELGAQIKALYLDYTASVVSNGKERIEIANAEAQQHRTHANEMAAIAIQEIQEQNKEAEAHGETADKKQKADAKAANALLALRAVELMQAEADQAQNADKTQAVMDAKALAVAKATAAYDAQAVAAARADKAAATGLPNGGEGNDGPVAALGSQSAVVSMFSGSIKDFGTGATQLAQGFEYFAQSANTIVNALQKEGALGGAGAAASSAGGLLSSMTNTFAKQLGPIVGAAGAVMSVIAGLFEAAAQKIADNLKKEITDITNKESDGTATLATTLVSLQQERVKMIQQLSGVKGGQALLDEMLPQLTQQIAALTYQIQQAALSFTNSMAAMSNGSDGALTSWVAAWQQVNTQVTTYLNAVGTTPAALANANAYLNTFLAQQQQTLTNNLDQGAQTAIADATNLNNLIQQRLDLEKQEQQTVFGIENADALERRASTAVTAASALRQTTDSYNLQLQNLNNQISLTQQKVDLESKIFNIAQDTATLELQSNSLTITALNQQLTQYQEMQQLLVATQGMVASGNPLNTLTAGGLGTDTNIPGVSVTGGIVVNLTIGSTNGVDGTAVGTAITNTLGTSIADAIIRNARVGKSQY